MPLRWKRDTAKRTIPVLQANSRGLEEGLNQNNAASLVDAGPRLVVFIQVGWDIRRFGEHPAESRLLPTKEFEYGLATRLRLLKPHAVVRVANNDSLPPFFR